MLEQQIVRIHGPYEDAIIAGCELAAKIVEGQPPEIKAELWKRHLEFTGPLHELAVGGMARIEMFFKALK